MRVWMLVRDGEGSDRTIIQATDDEVIATVWRLTKSRHNEGVWVVPGDVPWYYWLTPRKRWMAEVAKRSGYTWEED